MTTIEKCIRDINTLKESIRLLWVELAERSATKEERASILLQISEIEAELLELRGKLDGE